MHGLNEGHIAPYTGVLDFSRENSKQILQLNHKTDNHNQCSKTVRQEKKKILQSTIKYHKKVKIHTKIGVITRASSTCFHQDLNNDETTFFRVRKYGLQMLANWSLPKRVTELRSRIILQIHIKCVISLLNINLKSTVTGRSTPWHIYHSSWTWQQHDSVL